MELARQAKPAESEFGMMKALDGMALLGVAAMGVTGCVPQEPAAVETTTDSQVDSGEVDLSRESESTTRERRGTELRSDGTFSTDIGNGTRIRSDGTIGVELGNGTTLNSDGSVDFDLGNGFSINSDGGLNYNWSLD